MWTLGYDDNGEKFCFSEAFHVGRKLRPLVPRPLPSLRVNGVNFSSQYYQLEKSKREVLKNEKSLINPTTAPVVVSSSRWNPTAEQLRILEELYRRGTRTPSADQIQHITAQLRRYGKIEGKNVFYWFQNHKARERQKRRRQSVAQETKFSEAEKEYENEETKTKCMWGNPTPPPSTLLSQESVETQRKTKVVEFEQQQKIRRRKSVEERDGTWNYNNIFNYCQLINPSTNTLRHLNTVVESHNGNRQHIVVDDDDDNNEESKTTTLQLFPLCSNKSYKYDNERKGRRRDDRLEIVSDSDMTKSSSLSSSCGFQFFEFLPLKN